MLASASTLTFTDSAAGVDVVVPFVAAGTGRVSITDPALDGVAAVTDLDKTSGWRSAGWIDGVAGCDEEAREEAEA